MCLGMKNIRGNFSCKKTSTENVIKSQTIYMCHAAPGTFEWMTYTYMSICTKSVNTPATDEMTAAWSSCHLYIAVDLPSND